MGSEGKEGWRGEQESGDQELGEGNGEEGREVQWEYI